MSLPKLVVFDLDYTIWPFLVTTDIYPPFRKSVDSSSNPSKITIKDSRGTSVSTFPDITQILNHLKNELNIPCAVASRAGAMIRARDLLKLFEIDDFFINKQIYPQKKTNHFCFFRDELNFDPKDCLFFDDEIRNHHDLKPMGVFCVLVSQEDGVTWELYKKALEDFKAKSISEV